MSTQIYQFSSGQNNQAQQSVSGLKETSIDVDQLIELNKKDIESYKSSGLNNPAEFLQKKRVMAHGAPENSNLDIKFKKPPIAYYKKEEVFLPSKDTIYSDPTGKTASTFKSQLTNQFSLQNNPSQVVYGSSPQVVYSQPQTTVTYAKPSTYTTYAQPSSHITYAQPTTHITYAQPTTHVTYAQPTTTVTHTQAPVTFVGYESTEVKYSQPKTQVIYGEQKPQI